MAHFSRKTKKRAIRKKPIHRLRDKRKGKIAAKKIRKASKKKKKRTTRDIFG